MSVDPSWTYFINGQFEEFFTYMFTNYFIYGSFFLLLGIAIFSIVQAKTRDLNISTIVISIYFIVVAPFMLGTWFRQYTFYIQVLLGLAIGWGLYNLLVKKG